MNISELQQFHNTCDPRSGFSYRPHTMVTLKYAIELLQDMKVIEMPSTSALNFALNFKINELKTELENVKQSNS